MADHEREGEDAAGLDLVLVGAQGTEQQAQVIHAPVVNASEALGDRMVAPGPVAVARSIGSSSLEKGERARQPQPGPDVAAMALDALDHLVGGLSFPGVEHLLQQRPPVREMPVETPPWSRRECLRERLDPDTIRAARGKCPQALLDPPAQGVRVMAAMSCEITPGNCP